MAKKFVLFSLLALGLLAINPQQADAFGWLYTNSTYPVEATGVDANARVEKVGTSISKNYVGLVEVGDAGIEEATRNAGITKIHHVDAHVKSYFIFFSKLTVKVYGE